MIDKDTFTTEADFNGAKGLVFLDEKIVVIRRDDKTSHYPLHVDLPGGARETNETPFGTFKREVMEELGIEICEIDILFSRRYPSVIDSTKESYFMVTKPLNIKVSDIVFGDEGLEFFLIPPEEFVALGDGVPGQQDRVRDYLDMLSQTTH